MPTHLQMWQIHDTTYIQNEPRSIDYQRGRNCYGLGKLCRADQSLTQALQDVQYSARAERVRAAFRAGEAAHTKAQRSLSRGCLCSAREQPVWPGPWDQRSPLNGDQTMAPRALPGARCPGIHFLWKGGSFFPCLTDAESGHGTCWVWKGQGIDSEQRT